MRDRGKTALLLSSTQFQLTYPTPNINTDSSCSYTINTDMVLDSSPGPDVTMVPVRSAGHSDQHRPSSGMAL